MSCSVLYLILIGLQIKGLDFDLNCDVVSVSQIQNKNKAISVVKAEREEKCIQEDVPVCVYTSLTVQSVLLKISAVTEYRPTCSGVQTVFPGDFFLVLVLKENIVERKFFIVLF